MKTHLRIPKHFPVRPLRRYSTKARARATCGHCGLSWDDDIITQYTPSPSGRCPFEDFHIYQVTGPNPLEVLAKRLDELAISVQPPCSVDHDAIAHKLFDLRDYALSLSPKRRNNQYA